MNYVAVFGGATINLEKNGSSPTIGVDFITEKAGNGTHSDESLSHTTEFVLRIGGGYAFDLNTLSLVPSIDFDVARKHTALVIGLNVEYGF